MRSESNNPCFSIKFLVTDILRFFFKVWHTNLEHVGVTIEPPYSHITFGNVYPKAYFPKWDPVQWASRHTGMVRFSLSAHGQDPAFICFVHTCWHHPLLSNVPPDSPTRFSPESSECCTAGLKWVRSRLPCLDYTLGCRQRKEGCRQSCKSGCWPLSWCGIPSIFNDQEITTMLTRAFGSSSGECSLVRVLVCDVYKKKKKSQVTLKKKISFLTEKEVSIVLTDSAFISP